MQKLHKAKIPARENFPIMTDWLSTLDKNWDIPSAYLDRARKLRGTLLKFPSPQVLLHGDLHHDNILKDGEDWIAIDPKGVIGEPLNEIWAFINNPTPNLSIDIIERRVLIFANTLNIDANLIKSWCFVQSVLSWAWDLEDNLSPATINLTEIFNQLLC